MKVEDKRSIRKSADIGDMIITDKGCRFIVLDIGLDYSHISSDYTGLYDLKNNSIINTGRNMLYVIGEVLFSDTIAEIIPRDRLKLVIE